MPVVVTDAAAARSVNMRNHSRGFTSPIFAGIHIFRWSRASTFAICLVQSRTVLRLSKQDPA